VGCGHRRNVRARQSTLFLPTVPREKARRSALKQLVQTLFDGSTEQAVAALIDLSASKLSDQDLDRLAKLIEQARKLERSP
jgi:predicted transcriptional regulator